MACGSKTLPYSFNKFPGSFIFPWTLKPQVPVFAQLDHDGWTWMLFLAPLFWAVNLNVEFNAFLRFSLKHTHVYM